QVGAKDALDAPLRPLSYQKLISAENGVLIHSWQLTGGAGPSGGKVVGRGPAISAGGRFVAPANSFYLSPGGDLASPGYGVLRFTTPAGHAAKYQVETAVATIFPEPPQA